MKRAAIKIAIVVSMGRILQNEVAAICSDNFESILRLKTKDSVKDINHIISTIKKELNRKAPTLLSLLQWCKKVRSNSDELIATIVSIMCKHRRPSACIIQRVISLILYSGHSSKQVRDTINVPK